MDAIILSSSDLHSYYRPSKCALRVYLKQQGLPAGAEGPYEKILRRLGERHEQRYLEAFPATENIAAYPRSQRRRRTLEAVQHGASVLYHPVFAAQCTLHGRSCDVWGEPDLLIRSGEGYIIREVKMPLRINEQDHPEIIRQLQLYSWLYAQTFQRPPVRLEVFNGASAVEAVLDAGEETLLQLLDAIVGWRCATHEPFSPIGWSKCGGCGFHDYCWARAWKARD
ncbi:PD-(D/E)XK nuclease family protein, partial [candidate division FCPU426 bacterium]|nr:PD-(D/E)XK nuclease family protein [candidate division FCPU426 bacterium]